MINWGIIGTGNIAHSFARDFRFSNGGIISAVASRKLEKAQEFAKRYYVPKAYGSYKELLEDESIQVIYIATPNHLHFELSAEALGNGSAVLCEKPITTNPHDLKRLTEIAREAEQYLLEGLWTSFLPPIQKAKEWVQRGYIGKLRYIRAGFGFKAHFDPASRLFNPDMGGGALLDIGIYPIALAQFFVNQKPQRMSVISSKARTGVDQEETILMEYKNGVVANLTASFRFKLTNEATIIGDKGFIRIPEFFRATECCLFDDGELIDKFRDPRKSTGYNFEIDAVNQDLEAGRTESKVMPLSASLEIQEIMECVRQKM